MALEMSASGEKRIRGLARDDEACICSYECVFCAECAEAMKMICPNCGGELIRRPRPRKATTTAGES